MPYVVLGEKPEPFLTPSIAPRLRSPVSTEIRREYLNRAYGDITERQAKFVQAFIDTGDAMRALVIAGYGRVTKASAAQVLRNHRVAAAIRDAQDARARRTQITSDRVVRELGAIAFADMADVMEWRDNGTVSIRDSAALTKAARASIKRIKVTRRRYKDDDWETETVEVELHSKVEALEKLAKITNAYPDPTLRIAGPDGGSLSISHTLAGLTPEQISQLARAALATEIEGEWTPVVNDVLDDGEPDGSDTPGDNDSLGDNVYAETFHHNVSPGGNVSAETFHSLGYVGESSGLGDVEGGGGHAGGPGRGIRPLTAPPENPEFPEGVYTNPVATPDNGQGRASDGGNRIQHVPAEPPVIGPASPSGPFDEEVVYDYEAAEKAPDRPLDGAPDEFTRGWEG